MPTPQVVNPNNAFGQPVNGVAPFTDGCLYVELVADTSITAGQTVAVNSTRQAIVGTASNAVIGIALDTVVSGQVVRIAVSGIVVGLCVAPSAGVTAGDIYSQAASGSFGTGPSTTIGLNIITALTTATSGATFDVNVDKM